MLLKLSLILLLLIGKSFEENQVAPSQNIAFDLADLIYKFPTTNGEAQIEAFKSVANDQILNSHDGCLTGKCSRLSWVSIGNPTFLQSKDANGNYAIFHKSRRGFNALIEMLTNKQSEILAEEAAKKYSAKILPTQIVHLILSKLECVIDIYKNDVKLIIKGKVRELHNYPLRIDFWAPVGTIEWKIFEEMLSNEEPFDVECTLASQGKEIKVNTLVITAKQIQTMGLTEKLFGPTNTIDKSVYLTRKQMLQLAEEMYSCLNIVEEYEISQSEFSETFILEILRQTTKSGFEVVPFDEAMQSLSKFGLDFREDLRPDEIKLDLGRIFNYSTINNKSHIIVNNEYLETMKTSASKSNKGSVGIFSFSAAVDYARTSQDDWLKNNKSLDNQLKELNSASTNEFEWKLEGKRIFPKSIYVAKLLRANFSRAISFSRVKKYVYDSAFMRKIVIYTDKLATFQSDNLTLLPTGTIMSYASDKLPLYPWLLCHGQAVSRFVYQRLFLAIGVAYGIGDNITTFNLPDFRGRIPLGVDATQHYVPNAKSTGITGGKANHKLTVAEMPSHSHGTDKITVNQAGLHQHSINDPGHDHGGRTSSEISGAVSSWHVDRDAGDRPQGAEWHVHSHTIPRGYTGITVQDAGGHMHTLTGETNVVGNSQTFDTLPPFQTVNYIIYSA